METIMKQYQSESINELATALAKAQVEIKHAEKTAANPFFKSNYADLPSVFDASRPALSKHGISVVQFTDFDENGKVMLITQMSHSSGQWMRSWYPVNPVKGDPQSLGACVTYARRYSYCSMTGVAAIDEDDDGNVASGNHVQHATAKEAKETARARNARWESIKKDILASETLDDLHTVWAANYTHIQAFGSELTEELVRHKDDKKAQLQKEAAKDEALKGGFNDGFNSTK